MAKNLFGENGVFGDWAVTITSDGSVLYSPQTSANFLCNVTKDPAGDLVYCVQRIGKISKPIFETTLGYGYGSQKRNKIDEVRYDTLRHIP